MVLHIFNNQAKFSVKYFEFLKDYNTDFSKHKLFHYGKEIDELKNMSQLEKKFCRSFISIFPHFWLYKQMKKVDKIIVHSLASPLLLLMLFFNKELSNKIYWVIWGKDLYIHRDVKPYNLPYCIYEFFRKKVIKNIGHIITFIDGDYDLAVKWYNTSAVKETMDKVCYPYSVDVKIGVREKHEGGLNVLLGNSASKTNKHLDALDKLKKVDDGEMRIYTPLSYGGKKSYVKKVISKGEALFGDRFVPLTGFMEYDKYMNLLNSIDIGFFYHDRQEALNNTISLIAKKKTVYIRSDVTSWKFFMDNEIALYDSLNIEDELKQLSDVEMEENCNNIKNIWEPEFAYQQWSDIFN